jgi:hypothetical protein
MSLMRPSSVPGSLQKMPYKKTCWTIYIVSNWSYLAWIVNLMYYSGAPQRSEWIFPLNHGKNTLHFDEIWRITTITGILIDLFLY